MAEPKHDWYAAHWLKYYGKKQADVARDLDWNKAKVSLTFRGAQPYDREAINELADYFNLEPFELLMTPDRAMSYRSLRTSAEEITKLAHDAEPQPVGNLTDKIAARDVGGIESHKNARRSGVRD